MILTSRRLYVSPIKTGTTWVRRVLHARGGYSPVPKHRALYRFPATEYEGREVFTTVRSPWDWYRSLWLHASSMTETERQLLRAWGNGCADFRSVLYGWTHLAHAIIPHHHGVIWSEKDQPEVGPWGYCTWAMSNMLAESGKVGAPWMPDAYIPTSRLQRGLGIVLGETVPAPLRKHVNTRHSRPHPEAGLPYSDAYDDEMVEWVAEADRDLIDRFGFAPFERAPEPVYRRA